jgi:hypothetical protein
MVWTKLLTNAALAAALAGGIMLSVGATPARADDYNSCRRNVDKWEDRLHYDIDRHGPDSKQARHDRHELDEARDHCQRRFGDRWHQNYDYDQDSDRR